MARLTRRSLLHSTFAPPLLSRMAAEPARPNIVYILADDLGWGDLGCYNPYSAIPTPNYDRLASQGVRFTDMHSPSSVCTPTRYGILTGRYCWRSSLKRGVLNGYSPNLIEPGRLTVASLLKRAGYQTAGIGKWHLGLGTAEQADYSKTLSPSPLEHGFDSYFGIPASLDMAPYVYIQNDKAVEPPTSQTPGQNSPRGVFWRPGPIAPSFKIEDVHPTLTRKAIDFIHARPENRSNPFFLYLPLTAPHTPWLPSPGFRGRSRAGDFGDFVTQVDDTIGQVMRALDEKGLASNTLLIVTSDNGSHWTPEDKARFAHLSNSTWRGEKSDAWDGGHRIPFIARWPGKTRPGTVSSQLGCLTDLMATTAAITGQALPATAGEDSYSLLPALLGQTKAPGRNAIVHHSGDGAFAIRENNWKLILRLGSGGFSAPAKVDPAPGGPAGQLYDLAADPSENHNLYQKRPEIVASLTTLLERYQSQGHSRPL